MGRQIKCFAKLSTNELAEILGIKKRSARSKLANLAKTGRVTCVKKSMGPKTSSVYALHFPLKNLFSSPSDIQLAANGKVNYKYFCSDPFNLTKGAR